MVKNLAFGPIVDRLAKIQATPAITPSTSAIPSYVQLNWPFLVIQ